MKKLILLIIILYGCNHLEEKETNTIYIENQDTISLDFDSLTFKLKDTLILNRLGEEALLRNVTIKNHLDNDIYILKTDNRYKFIWPIISKFYDPKSKGWVARITDDWGVYSKEYYEIKAKETDTFLTIDLFTDIDSAYFKVLYFLDTTLKEEHNYSGMYIMKK